MGWMQAARILNYRFPFQLVPMVGTLCVTQTEKELVSASFVLFHFVCFFNFSAVVTVTCTAVRMPGVGL